MVLQDLQVTRSVRMTAEKRVPACERKSKTLLSERDFKIKYILSPKKPKSLQNNLQRRKRQDLEDLRSKGNREVLDEVLHLEENQRHNTCIFIE